MSYYNRLCINALALRQYRLEKNIHAINIKKIDPEVSSQSLSKIENAYYPPSTRELEKILKIYGVTLPQHQIVVDTLYTLHNDHLTKVFSTMGMICRYKYCRKYFSNLFKDRTIFSMIQ